MIFFIVAFAFRHRRHYTRLGVQVVLEVAVDGTFSATST